MKTRNSTLHSSGIYQVCRRADAAAMNGDFRCAEGCSQHHFREWWGGGPDVRAAKYVNSDPGELRAAATKCLEAASSVVRLLWNLPLCSMSIQQMWKLDVAGSVTWSVIGPD